jgi:hypothetical protein
MCKNTLQLVRGDMERTILPSWLSPVPREVGAASAGKLTADQWRTFCTVHLVVTLIPLWAALPPEDRRRDMLVNFLHLVNFTNLLHRRTMNSKRINVIEQENYAYLTGIRLLYPEFHLVPKHHMSLHLGPMLEAFGPVHAWRTFAFERLNQLFQNIPTNSRSGTCCLILLYSILNFDKVNWNKQY